MLAYKWQDVTLETTQLPGDLHKTLIAVHTPSQQTVSVPLVPRGSTASLMSDSGKPSSWSIEYDAKCEAIAALATMVPTCSVPLGENPQYPCQRAPEHTGIHAHCFLNYDDPILYDADDPTKMVIRHCHICFEVLTDENKGTGLASGVYCITHLDQGRAPTLKRNRCKQCGHDGQSPAHELRNHSMLWHDGDIHCGKCGAYVRMYDAG